MCSGVTRRAVTGVLAALSLFGAGAAHAQDGTDLLSGETLTVTGDARIVVADGEPSWLDGGFGKARFDGNAAGDAQLRPHLVEGNLIWQPRFTWALTGTVVVTAQEGQEHPVDLSEAVLTWKPLLPGPAKVTVRAGLYWPAISLEHSGPEWAVTDTITPSAINSWIGDEVKVVGAEATIAAPIGNHRVAATIGAFGFNDTSGTLLSFRGWALHDQKATAFGLQPLPPLNAMMATRQAAQTRPILEIDNKVGWYAKFGWSPAEAFELQFFHYDNRGDPEAVTPTQQWGWHTRFNNIGAVVSLGRIELRAQAMGGRTEMGRLRSGVIWVDTRFRSAYLLATHRFGRSAVSARVEAFGTSNRGSLVTDMDSEDGWALTAAVRRDLGPHLSVLGELLHIESDRPSRSRSALPAHQSTTQAQVALRMRF